MILAAWALAAATVPASGLQAQFEQANAALNAGQWEPALSQFRAIEAQQPRLSARTRGVIILSQAQALFSLHRDEEAVEAFRKGLALVPATDATLNDTRLDALMALGALDRRSYRYSAARHDFEEARSIAPDPSTRLKALLAAASVTMFDDANAARAMVDEAASISATGKASPAVDAAVRDVRGQVLLNQGDPTGALVEFQAAIKDNGGLTTRTDLQDVMVRSDAALAALQAHQDDRAREYLGMTGQGRLPDGPFATPADTEVPPCGGDIRPDDVVVVEFGIGDDGKVSFAQPVYASRQGPVAVEFAKAVSNWAWRQSDVKSIPLFYRAVTRVELRCSASTERPADSLLLEPALTAWLKERGVAGPDGMAMHDPVLLRAGLEGRKSAQPISKIPYLRALSGNPLAEDREKREFLEQAITIANEEHAPAAVQVLLRTSLLSLDQFRQASRYRSGLRELLALPGVSQDPHAAGVVRLMLAAPALGASSPSDATDLLQQTVDDQRLNARDPLRVGAMVRLASVQAQRGDLAAARQTYLGTGLNGQQCALVDVKPAMRRTGVGSNDYPVDALRWNIGGWTLIEFDVQPDGRTVNRRAIMSYPPFVFGQPTVKGMEATRYTQSYRPDGATGCAGASQRFRYVP